MEGYSEQLQNTIFERLTEGTSWSGLSKKFSVNIGKLRRTFARWAASASDCKPEDPTDITVPAILRGRPYALNDREEKLIVESTLYFADNNTPLTKEGITQLVKYYLYMVSPQRLAEIGFKQNRPSKKWFINFIR
eukprot:IDg6972t1